MQTLKDLLSPAVILAAVAPFYSSDKGRASEDPILLFKILFLSFLFNVKGDDNILSTLQQRLDWLQFCDLCIGAALPDRTTLVKFRRNIAPIVLAMVFKGQLETLKVLGFIDLKHRFFDGTPCKALAGIDMYRDEIYQDPLAVIDRRIQQLSCPQLPLDFDLNPTPVELAKDSYPQDGQAAEARRAEPMKPVSERQSAGDPDARFQRGKHGQKGVLGYEIFFPTDGKQMFITEVDVQCEANQGRAVFKEKLAASEPGQTWSVDAEFAVGEIVATAQEKKVALNTPPRPEHTAAGLYPKSAFVYNPADNTYTCPNQQTLAQAAENKTTGDRIYRPAKGVCAECPLRGQCTTSQTERTVSRSKYEQEMALQREHAKTPEAVMGRTLRGIIAEGKFAEAARHGLKFMRYVGKGMAQMQAGMIALILNFKRWLRVLDAQPKTA